ncbi:MAG: DUF2304 domain-containing protein [Anaerolineae bacterium]|jgi:hypothetical protein
MARVEVVALLGTVSLLLIIVEAVRRRRLSENYSLVWLLMAGVLVVLSLWRHGLDVLGGLIGIFYPPSALFVVGFGAVLLILFRFSIVISQLSEQNRRLAQHLALLDWQLRQAQSASLTTDHPSPDSE